MIGIYKGTLKGKEVKFYGSVVPDDYLFYGCVPELDKLVDSDKVEDRLLAVKKHYALEVLCDDSSWRVRLAVCKLGWDISKFENDPSKRVQNIMEKYRNGTYKPKKRRHMNYSESRRKHLEEYAKKHNLPIGGTFNNNGTLYGHILKCNKENQVDIIEKYNLTDGLTFKGFIPIDKVHRCAHHLNSSQVLCYNYFRPMVNDDHTPKPELIKLMKEHGISISEKARCDFEYDSYLDYKDEGTVYDFHIKDGETEVFFEIKYTEDGFHKPANNKSHRLKYDSTYHEMLKKCQCLKNKEIRYEDFLESYQLFRNVLRITNKKRYTLFVIAEGNHKIYEDIKSFYSNYIKDSYQENVRALCWEDLIEENHPLYEKYIAD